MNFANFLTTMRIFIVPFFVFCLKVNYNNFFKFLALILFVIACITDAVDGFVARKFNLISNFGKFFDPLADKILVSAAMICLVELHLIDSIYLIIIISREFLITSLRLIATLHNKVIDANFLGKLKTILQIVATTFVLYAHAFNLSKNLELISHCLLILATLTTLISGIIYFKQHYKLIFYS